MLLFPGNHKVALSTGSGLPWAISGARRKWSEKIPVKCKDLGLGALCYSFYVWAAVMVFRSPCDAFNAS